MGVREMESVITLLALAQDVLRDIMLDSTDNDVALMQIYCHALKELGILLQDTIVSIATYCGSYLDQEVGCEGTD